MQLGMFSLFIYLFVNEEFHLMPSKNLENKEK